MPGSEAGNLITWLWHHIWLIFSQESNIITGSSAHTDTKAIYTYYVISCRTWIHNIFLTFYRKLSDFLSESTQRTKVRVEYEFPGGWSRPVLPAPLDGWTLPGLSQRLRGKNGYTWSSWCAWCVIQAGGTSSTGCLMLGRNGIMRPPSAEMKTLTVMRMKRMKRKGEIGGNGGALLSPGWHAKWGNESSTAGTRSVFPGCGALLLSSL